MSISPTCDTNWNFLSNCWCSMLSPPPGLVVHTLGMKKSILLGLRSPDWPAIPGHRGCWPPYDWPHNLWVEDSELVDDPFRSCGAASFCAVPEDKPSDSALLRCARGSIEMVAQKPRLVHHGQLLPVCPLKVKQHDGYKWKLNTVQTWRKFPGISWWLIPVSYCGVYVCWVDMGSENYGRRYQSRMRSPDAQEGRSFGDLLTQKTKKKVISCTHRFEHFHTLWSTLGLCMHGALSAGLSQHIDSEEILRTSTGMRGASVNALLLGCIVLESDHTSHSHNSMRYLIVQSLLYPRTSMCPNYLSSENCTRQALCAERWSTCSKFSTVHDFFF